MAPFLDPDVDVPHAIRGQLRALELRIHLLVPPFDESVIPARSRVLDLFVHCRFYQEVSAEAAAREKIEVESRIRLVVS